MLTNEQTTLEKIRAAAIKEFMQKGFQKASLRSIVKEAGVTTGAFYGYFKSKDALFEDLVKDAYDYVITAFDEAHHAFADLPPESQPQEMDTFSSDCMHDILCYAYDHMDAFKLLICHSEGTRFSRLIDELVEIEVQSTHDYLSVLSQLGMNPPALDPHLVHILATGMLNMCFEMIRHDMSFERADNYLQELRDFYTAGWMKIMGQ